MNKLNNFTKASEEKEREESIDWDSIGMSNPNPKAVNVLYSFFDYLRKRNIESWKDVDHVVFQKFKKSKNVLSNILKPESKSELKRFWNVIRDKYCLDHDLDLPNKKMYGGDLYG